MISEIGKALSSVPGLGAILARLKTGGGDEEEPQDMYYGEAWAHRVLESVLHSPAWPRTLLIYTYDEHGGYYDHVPPPAAIEPDSIPPELTPADVPGAYNIYGPRVPAVVASPYSKPPRGYERRPRSHLRARHDRGQVEPSGAHLPGRQRRHGDGLPQSQ